MVRQLRARWVRAAAVCAMGPMCLGGTAPSVASVAGAVVAREHVSEARAGRLLNAADLIELAQIGGSRGALFVSPRGRFLLFAIRRASLADNTVRVSWWIAPADGGPARRIADGGEPMPDILEDGRPSGSALEPRAAWAPTGRQFAFLYRANGATHLGVATLEADTIETIDIGESDVVDFRWSADDQIDIKATAAAHVSQDERDGGYLFDGRFAPSASLSPLRQTLHPPPPVALRWRRGVGIERLVSYPAPPSDFPDEARLRAQSPSGAAAWTQASVAEAGYFAPTRLFRQRAEGGAVACPDANCAGAIEQIFWGQGERTLFFVKREGQSGATRALYAWDGAGASPRLVLRTNDMLSACTAVVTGVACIREAPAQPRTIALIEAENGASRTLFDPNPGFAEIGFGRIERITVTDDFDNTSFAHLVYPRDYQLGRRYPLIVVHYRWRGFLNGGVGGEYPIHLFAQQGYFVLEIDRPEDRARGARLSADALQAAYARNAYMRRMCYSALRIYLADLIARGLVDRDRIGLTGLSDGADSVYYALMHGTVIGAAITSTPPTDPYDYFLASADNRAYLVTTYGAGDPFAGSKEYWRRISPFYAASHMSTPLLMHLAQGEFIRATPFYTRMRDARRPVEMYVFEDEFHIKAQPRHFAAIFARNLAWFEFWLKNVETPAGVDDAVLARWRQMREAQASAD